MKDVDYPAWAEYIDDLIQIHHPDAETVHELSCGTGSMLIELDQFGIYQLTGSDRSAEMVKRASMKSEQYLSELQFFVDDFLNIQRSGSYDIVLSVFDSLNYVLKREDFRLLFESVERILAENGYFIFDFTTPEHSKVSIEWLDNEKTFSDSGVRILRRSSFDEMTSLHKNHFSVYTLNSSDQKLIGEELHIQRAYSLEEICNIISDLKWKIVATYADFDFKEAESTSHRVCIICSPNP
jgi:SAM-dependent methyltransferase